jgi:hypothetical protein
MVTNLGLFVFIIPLLNKLYLPISIFSASFLSSHCPPYSALLPRVPLSSIGRYLRPPVGLILQSVYSSHVCSINLSLNYGHVVIAFSPMCGS